MQPIQEKQWHTLLQDHLPSDEVIKTVCPDLSRQLIVKMVMVQSFLTGRNASSLIAFFFLRFPSQLYNQLAAQRSIHKRMVTMLLNADRLVLGPILFGHNAEAKQRVYFALAARILEPRWVLPTEQEALRVASWAEAWCV